MKKIIEAAIVIICMVVAFFVFKNFNPEKYIKPDDTSITAAQVAAAPQEDYAGKTAGADITRILTGEELEAVTTNTYVTAETEEVIATGIYSLKPWVDPYEITKVRNSKGRMVSTGRKAPEVTDNIVTTAEYYQEYYLVKLPDDSYVLAQFSDTYRERVNKGETVTLPMGRKQANSSAAKQALQKTCKEYGADNTYTLYMLDNQWEQEHENQFFFIRLAIAVVVFFALAITLLVIFYKFTDKA